MCVCVPGSRAAKLHPAKHRVITPLRRTGNWKRGLRGEYGAFTHKRVIFLPNTHSLRSAVFCHRQHVRALRSRASAFNSQVGKLHVSRRFGCVRDGAFTYWKEFRLMVTGQRSSPTVATSGANIDTN